MGHFGVCGDRKPHPQPRCSRKSFFPGFSRLTLKKDRGFGVPGTGENSRVFFRGKRVRTHVGTFGTGEPHNAGLAPSPLRAGGPRAPVLAGGTLWGQQGQDPTLNPKKPQTIPNPLWGVTHRGANFALGPSIPRAASETLWGQKGFGDIPWCGGPDPMAMG